MSLRISKNEYCQRLTTLQERVRERGLDLFVVSTFDNIYYLTGAGFEPLERPFFLLIKPVQEPTLLVPKLDQEHMKKARGIDDRNIITYREYPAPLSSGWPQRLKEQLPAGGTIGVEPAVTRAITDQLCGFSLRTEPLVEELRSVKSPAEIEMIRRAARYADYGVERLLAASYRGALVAEGFAQTRKVTAKTIREVKDWDGLTNRVVMATWAAPCSAMPHSVPELRDRLEVGPHVGLALTRVNGYSAESERTYFTAPYSEQHKEAFRAMIEARRLALEMVRPGQSCSALDARVNEFLREEGFASEETRLHRTGHGIGLGTHEGPWLAEGADDRLVENMVISIEPGIYLEREGGFRHSDTVLVTKDGYELLTRLPTDLDSLVITGWRLLRRCKGWLVRWTLDLGNRAATDPRPDS